MAALDARHPPTELYHAGQRMSAAHEKPGRRWRGCAVMRVPEVSGKPASRIFVRRENAPDAEFDFANLVGIPRRIGSQPVQSVRQLSDSRRS